MGKNILVFMDGTRNRPSDERVLEDSNVWKLYKAASISHDGTERTALYVRGVGTERDESVEAPADDLRLFRIREWIPPTGPARRLARLVHRIPKRLVLEVGAASVGWGVADRIREGYGFICRHYQPGDQVYLFGFSRGAFEARSLAGFIDAVGLLFKAQAYGPDRRRLVDKAYEIYRRRDPKAQAFLPKFLRRFTRQSAPGPATDFRKATEVPLHFVGVWDTVEALGIPELEMRGRKFSNASIPFVRSHTMHHAAAKLPPNVHWARHALAVHELRALFEPLLWEAPQDGQDMKQVWFAGAHADVGGGYPRMHLAEIALRWMAEEATAVSTGTPAPLAFHRLPPAPQPEPSLLPHHEMRGVFSRFKPGPRRAVVAFASLDPAVRTTVSVHPTVLSRLFDPAATTYLDYPFDPVVAWKAWFKTRSRYPDNVAGVLACLDDLSLELHIACLRAAGGNGGRAAAAAPARSPAWHGLASVGELRRADAHVAGVVRPLARWSRQAAPLQEALAALIACGREATLAAFIAGIERHAGRLLKAAERWPGAALAIRERRLPVFDILWDVVHGVADPALPGSERIVADMARRIEAARGPLQKGLPYPPSRLIVLDTSRYRLGPSKKLPGG